MSADPGSNPTYAAFLAGELKSEQDRRDAQVKTATGVITSSSALIALVLALFVLIAGKDVVFAGPSKLLILVTLLLFFLSAISALIAGRLMTYEVVALETIESMISHQWSDSERDSQLAIAWINRAAISSLRANSNRRSHWLGWSLQLQVVGAVALAFSVGVEVISLA